MLKNLDKKDLRKILRIKEPFLMIDTVINVSAGKFGLGIKKVEDDDWFYQCHFTDEPVMPGTLQTECMLQTIVSVIYSDENIKIRNCLVVKNTVNLLSMICGPGIIEVKAEITSINKGGIQAKAKLFFENKIVSDGSFRFIIPEYLKINH